jgi:hypothetical protein
MNERALKLSACAMIFPPTTSTNDTNAGMLSSCISMMYVLVISIPTGTWQAIQVFFSHGMYSVLHLLDHLQYFILQFWIGDRTVDESPERIEAEPHFIGIPRLAELPDIIRPSVPRLLIAINQPGVVRFLFVHPITPESRPRIRVRRCKDAVHRARRT